MRLLTTAIVAALAATGCSTSSGRNLGTTGDRPSVTAKSVPTPVADSEVVGPYVAVARYVLLIDNTFGGGGANPFGRVELGLDLTTGPRWVPAAAEPTGRPATAAEAATLALVVDTLAHGTDGSPALPVVAALPGAANNVPSDQTSPIASLRLSSVDFSDGGATARVSVAMVCGELCGWWARYVIDRGPAGWNVRGHEGPAAIS